MIFIRRRASFFGSFMHFFHIEVILSVLMDRTRVEVTDGEPAPAA